MVMAFDLETELIRPGLLAPPIVCGSYYWDEDGRGGCGVVPYNKKELYTFITDYIFGSNTEIVGHNVAYDMACICAEWPELTPQVFEWYENDMVSDTMVRQMIAEIAIDRRYKQYSLKDCVKRVLNEDIEKGVERVTYGPLRNKSRSEYPPGHISYALSDARATFNLYEAQKEKVGEYIRDEHRQTRAAFALHLISCWGLRTDKVAVEKLAAQTIDKIRELEGDLYKVGFLQYNKNKPLKPTKKMKKVREYMARVFPNAPLTDKGQISISEDACKLSKDPLLQKYAEYSIAASVRDKELPMLYAGIDTPITTRFTPIVATGRVSSSKPGGVLKGGNFQNWRRAPGIRECVIPRSGNSFVAGDYGAAELHTLAQVCITLLGESRLAEVLNSGLDPHIQTAANIIGETYDDMYARYKAGDERVIELRHLAKAANFGFPGGLGPATFTKYAYQSYDVDIDEETAAALRDIWFSTYPEVREYFGWINSHIDPVSGTMTVEHLFTKLLRGGASFCQACNSFFQNLCAEGTKEALWYVQKACYVGDSVLRLNRVVNCVHDEIMIEGPTEFVHESGLELKTIMVREFNKFVPDCPVDVDIVAMDRWSKKTEAVYENGRLVPFTVKY